MATPTEDKSVSALVRVADAQGLTREQASGGAERAAGIPDVADVGERRPRQWVRWLTWLAWPIGLIEAAIVLFVCYLHVSRTEAVS